MLGVVTQVFTVASNRQKICFSINFSKCHYPRVGLYVYLHVSFRQARSHRMIHYIKFKFYHLLIVFHQPKLISFQYAPACQMANPILVFLFFSELKYRAGSAISWNNTNWNNWPMQILWRLRGYSDVVSTTFCLSSNIPANQMIPDACKKLF